LKGTLLLCTYCYISGAVGSLGGPNIRRICRENPSSGTATARLVFNFILEPETL
jgi:hypothetical protein